VTGSYEAASRRFKSREGERSLFAQRTGVGEPLGETVYPSLVMTSLGRSVAVLGTAFAIAVAVGCGAVAAESKAVSPCGTASLPAWSPDGTQIAWYGKRWPLPDLHHASGSIKLLRAFCVSDANGKNLHPLAHTTCSEHCAQALSEPPGQLYWVASGMLYGSDAGIFAIPTGQKAALVARTPPNPFSTDTNGDRVAAGASECPNCRGPVEIFGAPSGTLVGRAGGSAFDNTAPSLSPDGSQVVFERATRGAGKPKGIWAASADGSHLRRLAPNGSSPLWSPAGNLVAYTAPAGEYPVALRLVAPGGGASRTLLPKIAGIFSWSPNGREILFSDTKTRLAVVDVTRGKVRTLLKLHPPYGPSAMAWSPDSKQLLLVWKPPAHSGCPSGLWRFPVGGGKPQLVHGC
jgi:WD40 repeat protein